MKPSTRYTTKECVVIPLDFLQLLQLAPQHDRIYAWYDLLLSGLHGEKSTVKEETEPEEQKLASNLKGIEPL